MSGYTYATTNRLTSGAVQHEQVDFVSTPPLLDEGVVIDGRYSIQGRLGGGSQAIVYQAEDKICGEDVALKMLAVRDEVALGRAIREAAVTEALGREAGIVAFKGAGISSEIGHDVPYIALELCENGSLRNVLRQVSEGPVAIEGIKKALIPVLQGIEAVHGAGLIHRDVKPDNIFLKNTGEGKIGDFGIVRAGIDTAEELRHYDLTPEVAAEALTVTNGGHMCTKSYAPPEVLIQGALFTPAGDAYGASLVACEVITGRHPYSYIMKPGIDYVDGVTRYDPKVEQPKAGSVSAEVLDFLKYKGLAADPKERATPAELRECIETL